MLTSKARIRTNRKRTFEFMNLKIIGLINKKMSMKDSLQTYFNKTYLKTIITHPRKSLMFHT